MKLKLMKGLNQSVVRLYQTKKTLGKGSGWNIDTATDHNIDISKHNPLTGSLVNIQNIDNNECFKC